MPPFRLPYLALLAAFALFSLPAHAEIGGHAGTHFGIGRMGSTESLSNPEKSVGTFDLEALPAWRFANSPWLLGLLVDLRFVAQLEDGAPGVRDYGGQSLLLGVGGGFEQGPFKLLLSYDPYARHWVSGPDLTFRGSGFHFLVAYRFEGQWSVDVQYVTTRYNSAEENGLAYGLNPAALRHWDLGFGLSYTF